MNSASAWGRTVSATFITQREAGFQRSISVTGMSLWTVELPRHSALVVRAYKPVVARSKRELAAAGTVLVHLGSSVIAFIGLFGGLFALKTFPIGGVLLTLGAMALLLYSVAVLCGAYPSARQ